MHATCCIPRQFSIAYMWKGQSDACNMLRTSSIPGIFSHLTSQHLTSSRKKLDVSIRIQCSTTFEQVLRVNKRTNTPKILSCRASRILPELHEVRGQTRSVQVTPHSRELHPPSLFRNVSHRINSMTRGAKPVSGYHGPGNTELIT
jgi:hypothetical protein